MLGDIPADRAVWTTPLVARSGAGAPIAEAFRALRAHIDHLRSRDGRHRFVVTAAGPRQGTTTITANLAVAIANTATSVVVVDADLRSSALSRCSACTARWASPRCSPDVVSGYCAAQQRRRPPDRPARGRPAFEPGELLATPTMRELLAELRRRFEVVIVDALAHLGGHRGGRARLVRRLDAARAEQGATTRPRLEDALVAARLGRQHPARHRARRDPAPQAVPPRAPRRRDRRSTAEATEFVPRNVARAGAKPARRQPVGGHGAGRRGGAARRCPSRFAEPAAAAPSPLRSPPRSPSPHRAPPGRRIETRPTRCRGPRGPGPRHPPRTHVAPANLAPPRPRRSLSRTAVELAAKRSGAATPRRPRRPRTSTPVAKRMPAGRREARAGRARPAKPPGAAEPATHPERPPRHPRRLGRAHPRPRRTSTPRSPPCRRRPPPSSGRGRSSPEIEEQSGRRRAGGAPNRDPPGPGEPVDPVRARSGEFEQRSRGGVRQAPAPVGLAPRAPTPSPR